IRHIQSLQRTDFYTDEQRIFDSIISQKKKYYQQRESLKEALELKDLPQRIECFDISHMQGEATVGSCVVFNTEGSFKQDYRRFSIKDITSGDDYEAMRQVLYRRYSRALKEDAALPDLVIIDGGWGQLNVAIAVLEELGLAHLDTIAISKGPDRKSGYEKILIAHSRKTVSFEMNHAGFLLLQHIRDEAHRFAVAGHQMARKKKRETSWLEQIPGIGMKRRRDLLRHFGGFQGVFSANLDSLVRVPGLHKELAKRIYTYLHGE
ncbi:MAG: helix-hairpin-helix domain-containing protein, partial [Gammaproteobacteria bacterium]|nr:helix-hairpin-helix domain-containing protein [Gammaproteobacteria bacterium]